MWVRMRLRSLFLAALSVAATFAGCAVDDVSPADPGTEGPVRRQKIGKADLWGSCENAAGDTFCGKKTPMGPRLIDSREKIALLVLLNER